MEFQMFSLKCGTEHLPIHWEMFILVKDENVIALTFTSHKPILTLALNNSMGPIEKWQTPGSAWDTLWVVIRYILYQLSNLITINLYLIGYKVHFHIGLWSVNELDPHYKPTTWHSYLARLTHPDKTNSHIMHRIYIYRLIESHIKWVLHRFCNLRTSNV